MKTVMKSIAIILLALAISCTDSFAQDTHPCKATTKEGKPCKMSAVKGSDYCMVHNPNTIRCGAIKKDGKPCQMRVKNAGEHCRYHQ